MLSILYLGGGTQFLNINTPNEKLSLSLSCFFLHLVDLNTAKDLLVMASTVDEQHQWVENLSKKIVRRDAAVKKR